jgi:hypothetical protein
LVFREICLAFLCAARNVTPIRKDVAMTAATHISVSQTNPATASLLVPAQVYRRRRIGVSALLAVTVFIVSFLGGEFLSDIIDRSESPGLGVTSEISVYAAETEDIPWK